MLQDSRFRSRLWVGGILAIVVSAVYLGISAVLPRPGAPGGLMALGVVLALIPAAVWLAFFSQPDQTSPEPIRLLIRVFVFGALAATAAVPVTQSMTTLTLDQFPNLIVRIVLFILSVGLLQEVLKVAIVRYVVLGTAEFDQHPDGVVYGLACGMGFATVLTTSYVLNSGGVLPLAGAVRALNNVFVHGALGAVSGYYIGRVKIDGKKLGWMLVGLTAVAAFNGLYQIALDELDSQFGFNPWYGLAIAAGLAAIVSTVLFLIYRRAMARATGDLSTVSVQAHARSSSMPWDIALRYDYLLIGAVLLALIVGFGAGGISSAANLRHSATDTLPIDFRYPRRWAIQSDEPTAFAVRDLTSAGIFKPTLFVESDKVSPGVTAELYRVQQIVSLEGNHLYFDQLAQSDVEVDGVVGTQLEYKYATNTVAGPAVVRGIETYVERGSRVFILRYEAEAEHFDRSFPHYMNLLSTASFAE